MRILVTGGNDSGKSRYAERTIAALAERTDCPRLLYLATLDAHSGGDTPARIARHRAQRRALHFRTIECPRADCAIFSHCSPRSDCVLLEDIGNLCANEFFLPPDYAAQDSERCFGAIMRFFDTLFASCAQAVLVANNIAEAAPFWEEIPCQTLAYLRLLGRVTNALAARCDAVHELVCGIPLQHSMKSHII